MILRLKLIEHGWLTDKTIDYIVNVSDKYRWKLVLSNFEIEQPYFDFFSFNEKGKNPSNKFVKLPSFLHISKKCTTGG